MNILAIIPARGDSKGIPRKNIRNLAGKPLIYYAINTALNSSYNIDVYVSSDDDEILHISKSLGAKIHKRSKNLATDTITLDPVIYEAYSSISKIENKKYDYVITLQPTSPLLKSSTLDLAIKKTIENDIDTMISAKEDTHLSWRKENGRFVPNYKKRVNRQQLEPIYKETGGFVISKSSCITRESRFGDKIDLFLLKNGEDIDIDDYEDWSICEYYLKRKNILFVVKGNKEVGLGHVYNTLIIANDITEHNIHFLVEKDSKLGFEKIKSKNFSVSLQKNDNIIEDILELKPDVVINDRLTNEVNYIKTLKKHNIKVINIEDNSESSNFADLVINAIYSTKEFIPNHYYGYQYYILRDEFILQTPVKNINEKVQNVLISFGGTDPNNLTYKVLDSIYEYCIENQIQISVIFGLGYDQEETIKKFKKIKVYKDIKNISEHMIKSDIIFAAMGRMMYEIASLGIPAILMAQNKRELTHTFGYGQNGFINLGYGKEVSNKTILENFIKLVECSECRKQMNSLMLQHDIRSGRKRAIKLIKDLIEEI